MMRPVAETAEPTFHRIRIGQVSTVAFLLSGESAVLTGSEVHQGGRATP